MEFKLGPQETLTQPGIEWNFETDKDAELLEQAMINFMIENRGIGLAANQVGLDKRVFVIGSNNILGFPKPFAVFNPKIIEVSEQQCSDKEGCLSFPDLWLTVKRPEWIIAQYQDSTGNLHEVKMDGYIARCFQHEYDHLDGICFVDKVSQMKLQLAMKKLRKTNK